MTLSELERRNGPYFAFFSPNSTDFQADYNGYRKTYKPIVRKILSPSSPVFHF